jgi:hypothetical protein
MQQCQRLVKIPLYICTLFDQCTYMGYLLLEAPRIYVQHGPLPSINWLRLCPQSGAPRPKPHRPEEVVYSPNDSCSHFTQRLFPPKPPQQHTWVISYGTLNIIHIFYTSHLHAHLYLLFTWHDHTFTSSDLHGRQAALSPLCSIQLQRNDSLALARSILAIESTHQSGR